MKEVTQYICEICGTQYKDRLECQKCESQHKVPIEITCAKHLPYKVSATYPTRIAVKFNDGHVIEYEKKSRVY